MVRLNSSYISDLQSRDLETKIESSKNTVDLWYEGYDRNNPSRSFEQYGKYSHVNRALLWLASKPRDFVRSSWTGGVLYSLIGQLGSDTNLKEWEDEIMERFNEEFAGDLQLMYITLNIDKKRRVLSINMIVRDAISNEMYPITTEATLESNV